jgi:hypothetical protein
MCEIENEKVRIGDKGRNSNRKRESRETTKEGDLYRE